MQFTELTLLKTSPFIWNGEPPDNDIPQHAEKLRDFLLYLLDVERPGLGALFPSVSDNNEPVWLCNDQAALAWVHDTYERLWKPQAEVLQAKNTTSRYVFDEYQRHRAEVFLDRERLVACFRSMNIEASVPQNTFISLSIEWSDDDPWLWLTPQLRICNYWPHDRRYAPPPSSALLVAPPVSFEQAADTLKDLSVISFDFDKLREHYLPVIGVTLEVVPEGVLSPIFLFAKPQSNPGKPEEFLAGEHLRTLEKLWRRVGGGYMQDLLSAEISGALLEGNILTFRREVDSPYQAAGLKKVWQTQYLLVPWLPDESLELAKEVERESFFVAAMLTFCEIVAGGERHMGIGKFMRRSGIVLGHLSARVEEGLNIARWLQRQVAFAMKPQVREIVYELVQQLYSSVSRLSVVLLYETENVLSKKREWHQVHEAVIQHAHRVLTVRVLPQVSPLLEALSYSRPHVTLKKTLENQAQEARRIQSKVRDAIASLRDALGRERRESQDREGRRQQLIGYALAALAAVGAFPLLIGQSNWSELQTEIQKWPYPLTWVGTMYITPHPYLLLLAMVSATALIGLIIYGLTRVIRKWEKHSAYNKEICEWGNKLLEIELIMARDEPAEDARQKQDDEVCKKLRGVWNWYNRKLSTGSRGALVAAFVINTELLTKLPIPKGLPKALCLCRYVIPSINNRVLTDGDFKALLLECGLTPEEVDIIERRSNEYNEENFIEWVMGSDFRIPLEKAAA